MKKIKNKNRAFSLLEMIIYIAMLSIFVVLLSNFISIASRSYAGIKASREINRSSMMVLDRIAYEVRSAVLVNEESLFGSHPGFLSLKVNGQLTQFADVDFYLDEARLMMRKEGSELGPLTSKDVRVTELVFHRYEGSQSEMIQIEIDMESGSQESLRKERFYYSVVLRNKN